MVVAAGSLPAGGGGWLRHHPVAVPVTVFDDDRHHAPVLHATPFLATTLLFIPGVLLHNDNGQPPTDWAAVIRDR